MSVMGLSVTQKVHFISKRSGQRAIRAGARSAAPPAPPGTVPRVSRLMALAIRFDGLIRSGAITDRAELARLGHVTRARVTQIMNLLHLAPGIQQAILFLPQTLKGCDPIHEHDLRPIAATIDWAAQREQWTQLVGHGQPKTGLPAL